MPGAAHKLRRNLEAELSEITASLQGQVTFRPDNNYELNAFFSAVKSRHGDLLKKAAASANSWNNEAAKEQVEALKAKRSAAMLAQDGENWAINALVHNNDWATMSKADFEPVLDACKQFLGLNHPGFRPPPDCREWRDDWDAEVPGWDEQVQRCDA